MARSPMSRSQQLTLYAFGSWKSPKIKDNILLSENFGISDCDAVTDQTTTAALRSCAFTAGNYESGSPKYMFGGSALGRLGVFELGATVKRTGPRYVFDTNLPTFLNGTTQGTAAAVEIFPSKTPAYTLVNLDARVKLTMLKGLEKSYFQLNVYNLFDEFYVGGFGGGLNQAVNSGRHVLRQPELRPGRRSAHDLGHAEHRLLRLSTSQKGAAPHLRVGRRFLYAGPVRAVVALANALFAFAAGSGPGQIWRAVRRHPLLMFLLRSLPPSLPEGSFFLARRSKRVILLRCTTSKGLRCEGFRPWGVSRHSFTPPDSAP